MPFYFLTNKAESGEAIGKKFVMSKKSAIVLSIDRGCWQIFLVKCILSFILLQLGSLSSAGSLSEAVMDNNGQTYVVQVNTSLTIRERPSTESRRIGSLRNNDQVKVVSIADGWAQISIDGGFGFVAYQYLAPLAENARGITKHFSTTIMPWGLSYRESLLWLMFIVLLLKTLGHYLFFDTGFYQLLLFLLPGLLLLYVFTVQEPMWYCTPKKYGYIIFAINVLILAAYANSLFRSLKRCVLAMFSDFSLYKLLLGILFLFALVELCIVAWQQLLAFAIFIIIGTVLDGASKSTRSDDGSRTVVYDEYGEHEVKETGFGEYTEIGSGRIWRQPYSGSDRVKRD